VSPRNPTPAADPTVDRLGDPNNLPDAEDVIALVGFVGPGREDGFRIHPDRDLQRWLEVPALVDSQRVDPEDELSRSVVWVNREMMLEQIFEGAPNESDGRLQDVANVLVDAPFSTWNLIPETRLAAAILLGLIAYGEEEQIGGQP
jgi:hypothetical protein